MCNQDLKHDLYVMGGTDHADRKINKLHCSEITHTNGTAFSRIVINKHTASSGRSVFLTSITRAVIMVVIPSIQGWGQLLYNCS